MISLTVRIHPKFSTHLVREGLALQVRVAVVPLQNVGSPPLSHNVPLSGAFMGIHSLLRYYGFPVLWRVPITRRCCSMSRSAVEVYAYLRVSFGGVEDGKADVEAFGSEFPGEGTPLLFDGQLRFVLVWETDDHVSTQRVKSDSVHLSLLLSLARDCTMSHRPSDQKTCLRLARTHLPLCFSLRIPPEGFLHR